VLPEAPAVTTPISKSLVPKASRSNKKKKRQTPKSDNVWSLEEDEILQHTVQTMESTTGSTNWKLVASAFEERVPFACENRWKKLIKPRKDPQT
jgi:hypothetical protein